jgi:hypothetical protein
MAGPNDPPVDPNMPDPAQIAAVGDAADKSAEQLGNLSDMAIEAQGSFSSLNGIISKSSGMFSTLDGMIKGVGISLNVSKALTEDQVTQFSLLSNVVLGARDSYKALAGTDFSGFKNQIDDLTKLAVESPLSPMAAKARQALESVAAAGGKTGAEISKMSTQSLGLLASSLITSADNALKLQTGFLQLAGKTGGLNSIFEVAGPKLENINVLLEKQAKMMSDSIIATGAAPEVVEKYYMALGSVPGALTSLVTSSGNANQKTTMLTAAMKVASGTGRDFSDIVDDLRVAFKDYGMTGESALKFSAQISAVTQNLGVELETVRSALRGNAEAFKMFVNSGASASIMASGMADIMNNYAKALESTGLSGTQAVDVIANMTKQISGMGIAQKSFLSSQTGGAGGLMGAFQIDKMMREGDMKGVFEKVRQQMQKQFGSIVSLDEASKSQGAAAQMTKQMMILKQGPLGQFARSDAEAQRIIEGFKSAQEGGGGGAVNPDILKDTMDKGTSVQEKSYSVMSDMRGHLEAIRRSADIGTLSFMQKSGMTAGAGVNTAGMVQNEAAYKASMGLKGAMGGAANMNTQDVSGSYADVMAKKKLIDTSGKDAVAAITGLQGVFKLLPDVIKGPAEALKKTIASGDVKGTQDQIKLLEAGIKKRKEEAKKADVDKRTQLMDEIAKEELALSKAKAYFDVSSGSAPPAVNFAAAAGAGKASPPGAKVGAAANKASGVPGVAPGAPKGGALAASGPPGSAGPFKQDVTVHVTGFCLKCKQEIDSNAQGNAISPQGKSV